LAELKDEYKALKFEIGDLDGKAEFLKTRVKECEDEFDELEEMIKIKKLEIE
jgi:peptidoglycan hydrolase CwlO-like protein